eukprot:gnl/Dysnectes_brevis/5748_a8462_535.p1 GENE.gnl/Dysnectes_brevis/5748_a8462_535~~gnl/Dysnectes_brevis/5748_a8462_535.p1  ORF type:complete len:613 (+),score=19.61 gnl/Dysnectes_brevis/5748_a8462_535:90-1928(+)
MSLRGLRNKGTNTCYLNTALQCLASFQKLTQFTLSFPIDGHVNTDRGRTKGRLFRAYSNLLRDLFRRELQVASAQHVKEALTKVAHQFRGRRMHDTHEVLSVLIETLIEELNTVDPPPYKQLDTAGLSLVEAADLYHQHRISHVQCPIADMFTSRICSSFTCHHCEQRLHVFQYTSSLTLHIPNGGQLQRPLLVSGINPDTVRTGCIILPSTAKPNAHQLVRMGMDRVGGGTLGLLITQKKEETRGVGRNIAVMWPERQITAASLLASEGETSHMLLFPGEGFEDPTSIVVVVRLHQPPFEPFLDSADPDYKGDRRSYIAFVVHDVPLDALRVRMDQNTILKRIREAARPLLPPSCHLRLDHSPGGLQPSPDDPSDDPSTGEGAVLHLQVDTPVVPIHYTCGPTGYRRRLTDVPTPLRRVAVFSCTVLSHTTASQAQLKLPLEMSPPSSSARPRPPGLEACVERFGMREELSPERGNSFFCEKCETSASATHQMSFYSLPPCLVIHLRRFLVSSSGLGRAKLSVFVPYPLEGWDLSKYILPQSPHADDPAVYDLFAVSCHRGGGCGGGHYVAFCKNFTNGEWHEYSDDKVRRIQDKDVLTNEAYVLFYRRRE